MTPYQIDGRTLLFDWLARETDPERRRGMLEWLVGLSDDPTGHGQRLPGVRSPIYIAVVPLVPPVVITYLLAEQFRTVKLIRISDLP